MRWTAALLLTTTLLSGCAPKTPDLREQIKFAVGQTLAAAPTATPPPTLRVPPTPTPLTLKGIFCEYQFCIGHPEDLAFYDVIAKQNPDSPASSGYDSGILAANNTKLFIQLVWQSAGSGTDPAVLLDVVLDSRVDTRGGSSEPLTVGNVNAVYVPINSAATALLPYGGGGAWTCGARAFAWKAYAAQPDLAKPLFMQALQAFRCE